MKKVIVAFILLSLSFQMQAQDLDYGDVEAIDFTLKAKGLTETPDAVFILKKEHLDFVIAQNNGFTQRRTVHERIKINTEDGLKYATKKVLLYMEDGSYTEKLKKLEAATYNLEGDKVKRKKLKKSGIFEEDLSDSYRFKSFTLPEVKVGSVIEYTYVIESPYAVIDDIVLQYEVPILNIDVRMVWLESYQYVLHFNPRATYIPKFEYEKGVYQITASGSERSGSRVTKTNFTNAKISVDTQIVSFQGTDVTALITEPLAGDVDKYRAKVIVELVARGYKQYANSWETVSKTILESKSFGDQMKPARFFRDDLNEVIQDKNSCKEKIEAIFQFVKDKVKWDKFYGKYVKNGVKEAYNKGSGNVADINLLLIAMLREAGLESYPVLVSTKDNGIPFYATKDGFNYVIASVKSGERLFLLDATEPRSSLEILPPRVMNWKGRIILEDGRSDWVDLSPNKDSKEIILVNGEFNDEGSINLEVRKSLTNYLALNTRMRNDDSASLTKSLKSGDTSMEISNIETENMEGNKGPVTISYKGLITSASEEIGGRLFITPLLHEANEENPFKLEKRNFPIDLTFPYATKTIVNIKIPEGYKVEFLPESVKLMYNNGQGSYTYKLSEVNGIINIIAVYDMDVHLIEPESYEFFKKFFEAIVSKDAEKIVLRKI
jgi:hypothetical protein